MSLKQIHEAYGRDPLMLPCKTKFYGWIRRVRIGGGGDLAFIDIYDGTHIGSLMTIASKSDYMGDKFCDIHLEDELTGSDKFTTLSFEQLSTSGCLSDGCSVVADGLIVKSPENMKQLYEMHVSRLRVICGVGDPMKYPINKTSEKQLTTLRNLPFMRLRTQLMQSIFRICSTLELAVHIFMNDNDVTKIDPNIITMSDCEGAGETFTVSPLIFSEDDEGKDIPVGLTVSSQLPLESAITGLRQVYTAQKYFRAEKSDTCKHLAEFFHVEYEGAFMTLDKLMGFTEMYVKSIIKYTLEHRKEDFDFLETQSDVIPSRKLLMQLLDKPFIKIKHCDAVRLIESLVYDKKELPEDGKMKRVKVDKMPKQGEDLGVEHEKILTRYFGWIQCTEAERELKMKNKEEFSAFVFLTHWPLKIKSFYMKQCDDGSGESESFDLLAPRVGELFGGSMREWRYDKLDEEIKRRGMDVRPIQWFVDLRKSGSMPHGGWGMGFARMAMLMTGVPSVRDVVFMPVYYGHCPY
jgi:asparaginyl-tRNA synthetase